MKNSILLLVLIGLIPVNSIASDLLFNRLEKLKQKDPNKCLEVSKRYMNYFPDDPSSYYFSSVIYQERSEKSKTIQGKFRNLKKSISYAIQFEEKDQEDLASRVLWDDFKSTLSSQALLVVDQLEAAGEESYSAQLMKSLSSFDAQAERLVVEVVEKKENTESMALVSEAMSPVTISINSSTELYGMPQGNEVVESFDSKEEQKLLALINSERKKQGMEPLVWEEDLANAARYHAYDLASQDYFDHSTYDRKSTKLVRVGSTFDRIKKFYNNSFVNSENIAAGNGSAQETYEQWYNSKGHYENMFNPNSRKVGLGVAYKEGSTYGYYWVFCTAH